MRTGRERLNATHRAQGVEGADAARAERGGLLSRDHASKAFDLLDPKFVGEITPSALDYGAYTPHEHTHARMHTQARAHKHARTPARSLALT